MRTALVILLLFAAVAKGQIPIYKLDTNRQVHYLAGTTAILVDSVEKFITNEVLSGEKDHLFVRYNSVANQKNKNYTYWLRFAVQPIGSVNNWVMLVEEIDHNDLYNDRLESFVLGPDRKLISSDQAGPLIKRSAKKLRHSAGFNGLSFSANQQVVVYIKVSNPFRSTTGYSQPVIQHPAIPNSINPVAPLLSILNVIATLFCIMSFFFYIFVKEKAYLFFCLLYARSFPALSHLASGRSVRRFLYSGTSGLIAWFLVFVNGRRIFSFLSFWEIVYEPAFPGS